MLVDHGNSLKHLFQQKKLDSIIILACLAKWTSNSLPNNTVGFVDPPSNPLIRMRNYRLQVDLSTNKFTETT